MRLAKLKEWRPEFEKGILKRWKNIYKFRKKNGKIFIIDTPPPYPSGWPWHIGAAAHYSQIDMIARTARMLGFNVFFPIGIDRNGIPVEKYVEKEIKMKMFDLPREEFIKICSKTLNKLEKKFLEIMKGMGMSCDFDNCYRTDSKEYRKLTQETFIKLFEKGLIYFSTRPNNYCFDCQTILADADVVYEEVQGELFYIKFRIEETNEQIVVATTRPELLCSCQVIIVNPKDKRYEKLHNLHAIIPIYERSVPIIPHPAANPEFGTGIAMVCSYGDFSDVRLFRELGLKEIIAIDMHGKMTKEAGQYSDLPVEIARKKIVEDLEKVGLIAKKEQITHKIPVCERSGIPIEIIPMQEIYLKQLDFKEKIKKIAKKIKFFPEIQKQTLLDWVESLTIDWPISRRRYYATEIPIWYCKKCWEIHLPEPGKYWITWKQNPFKKCKKCKSKEFVAEQRVFDTWFDSSISPLFISNYFTKKVSKKLYPATLRPQGRDIIRTWLYYTLLRCYQLTRKPCFKYVWIGGMGLDEKGERMSKSKGNVIDPLPLIEKYGADAFRFWNANVASQGSDFRCSEKRIEIASRFLTKLWNVARFISEFPFPKKAKLRQTDKWILAELQKLINECLDGYREFNFFIPSTKIREFLWNIFAPHYIEMVKTRAYKFEENSKGAWYALHFSLRTILLLLAPITPFITDFIWRELYGKNSIHLEKFPRVKKVNERLIKLTEKIIEFNSHVWKEKKRMNLPLKAEIKIEIPKELLELKEDLTEMHKLKK